MADVLINHFGELMIGMVLAVFGAGFRNWSSAIKESTRQIIGELKLLAKEFQSHRIEIEKRVTRVETRIENMERKNGKGPGS
jgi:hypothetical protein